MNLCQPPIDENTINTRLDCVEELLLNEECYIGLRALLKHIPNIDSIISCLVTIDHLTNSSESRCQRNVGAVLQLKSLLETVPKLALVRTKTLVSSFIDLLPIAASYSQQPTSSGNGEKLQRPEDPGDVGRDRRDAI